MSKGAPIPTRFGPKEEEAIDSLHQRTGLSRAEIVRRAVRLLTRRYKEIGNAGFIIEELAPTVAEQPPAYGPTIRRAGRAAAKFNKTKKAQATRKRAA